MNTTTASAARLRAAALALALGASLTLTPAAFGQATAHPPERMTYQGFLVDGNGAALGGAGTKNYDVIFRIYSDATGGDLKWSEQQTVTVDKGYFSVLLGEGAQVNSEAHPALSTLFKGADASDRYVAITVKGIGSGGANVDINPRLRLMTSPYSFLAEQATKLVRADNNADLISSTGDVLSLNGHFDILGNNSLEFGAGVAGKQNDAGRMGYNLYNNAGNLDIVGAGTEGNNRKIKLWAEGGLTVAGPVTATSFSGTHAGDGSGLAGVAKLGANTFTGQQDIQNHLRLGELASSGNAAGWGEALIFSGAPPLSLNADNTDPLWLARYNTAANSSDLRMVIGDDPGSAGDRFVIGTMQGAGNFSQTATWAPQVTIDARGFMGLNGRSADYPLTFPNTLGDKITLWGNAGSAHYGFGIQNSTLQIYSDISASAVAFGYGDSANFNETARITYDALYVNHPTHPQVQLRRPDGRYAQFYRDQLGIIIGLNLSNHNTDFRYAYYNGDANWDFPSDRRLKKNIVDAEPVLERVLKVQVRNYQWKTSGPDAKPMLGVIAQELQPIFPDMVTEMEEPMTENKILAVGYGDFAVIAIKAIQELKAQHDVEVKDLKAEVADLKAQMKQVLQAAAELQAASDKSKTTAAVTK